MGSAKKQFRLQQETPMIHFQPKEPGAGPRPTEIKSKLDKFLLSRIGQIPEKWFIDREQSQALNYKLRIYTNGEPELQDPGEKENQHMKNLYFGNMGDVEKKYAVFYREPLTLEIVCFFPELLKIIERELNLFFLLHNFGTRQNKGFGSFTVQRDAQNSYNPSALYARMVNEDFSVYAIHYEKNLMGKQLCKAMLKDVQTISSMLKGGINFRGTYIKSFLVKYCLDQEPSFAGEKRFLKQQGMAPALGKSAERRTADVKERVEYKYLRALLGSAGSYDFIQRMKENGAPDFRSKKTISVSAVDEVQRIPSPILYKPVGNTLYILVHSMPEAVNQLKPRFAFAAKGERALSLEVPGKDEVDIQKVFQAYVRELNRETSIYHRQLRKQIYTIRRKESSS